MNTLTPIICLNMANIKHGPEVVGSKIVSVFMVVIAFDFIASIIPLDQGNGFVPVIHVTLKDGQKFTCEWPANETENNWPLLKLIKE